MALIYNLFKRTYNKLWHEAQTQLGDLLQVEMPKGEAKPENVNI